MTTKTTLTALALAAAAFTSLAGGASALDLQNLPGHGPVVTGIQIPPRQVGTIGPISGINHNPPQVRPWRPGPGHFPPPHESEPTKGSGGVVISCSPVTGCTKTPGGDRDRDHDWDRDHDHGWDRDHDHYGYRDFYRWYHNWNYGYWYPRYNWTLPPVYTSYYPTYSAPVETCSYEYKWSSIYQPGYGLRRVVVKTCAGS
jgi:hypothetical protein